MKSHIESLLQQTIASFQQQGIVPADFQARIQVDRTKDKSHGDLATNLAMMLTKVVGKPPREVAQLIIDTLPKSSHVAKVDIAGPGFINFFIISPFSETTYKFPEPSLNLESIAIFSPSSKTNLANFEVSPSSIVPLPFASLC